MTPTRQLIFLALVTFIAYANAWPDTLVGDDSLFAVSDRFSNIGLAGMARFFTNDVWELGGVNSGLYRPLLLVSIMLDTRLFGDWVAGYHLINILLHVLTTLLVYGLVRYLLRHDGGASAQAGHMALLAALVFAVHPVHAEAVNSIFNRSEILVALGVVGGLWWFLRKREQQPWIAWFGLNLIYLLVLLCRESGVMLPALTVALLWFTLPGTWLLRLRQCLPVLLLLIPLGIYLMLRANALAPPPVAGETGAPVTTQVSALPQTAVDAPQPGEAAQAQAPPPAETAETVAPPAGKASVSSQPADAMPAASAKAESMAQEQAAAPPPTGAAAPAMTEDSAAQQPQPPAASPGWLADRLGQVSGVFATFRNYNPGRLLKAVRMGADALKIMLWPHPLLLYHGDPQTGLGWALALQLALLAAAVAGFICHRPGLLIGLSFFYLALLPSTGILLADKVELAERFLYLPSAGLAMALAFGLRWLARRFSLRLAALSILAVTAILTPVTWARNAEWASNVLLAEAEYRKGTPSGHVLQSLVVHNLNANNIARALEICHRHADDAGWDSGFAYQCGFAYERAGRYQEAQQAYTFASKNPHTSARASLALALLNVQLRNTQEAKRFFEQAIALEDQLFVKEFHTALMLVKLYPFDQSRMEEARNHLERTLTLQPEYFPARKMLEQLDQILGPGGRFDRRNRQ